MSASVAPKQKSKSKATHPGYISMIQLAIMAQPNRMASESTICKWMESSTWKVKVSNRWFKKALVKGVKDGTLAFDNKTNIYKVKKNLTKTKSNKKKKQKRSNKTKHKPYGAPPAPKFHGKPHGRFTCCEKIKHAFDKDKLHGIMTKLRSEIDEMHDQKNEWIATKRKMFEKYDTDKDDVINKDSLIDLLIDCGYPASIAPTQAAKIIKEYGNEETGCISYEQWKNKFSSMIKFYFFHHRITPEMIKNGYVWYSNSESHQLPGIFDEILTDEFPSDYI
eukprot:462629_1